MRDEKRVVKEFYENYGWRSTNEGLYNDTADFVDVRPVLKEYQRNTMGRISATLPKRGGFFLDAGCGAVPSEQHARLCEGYSHRVCVDFSLAALGEARKKLGEKALYVQADITCLPFRKESFDAILCAHVLYHIPPDEQGLAIREIGSALTREGLAAIVYTWPMCLMTKLAINLNPRMVLPRIPGARYIWRKLFRPASYDSVSASCQNAGAPSLYFYPQDFLTMKKHFTGLRWEMRCWQSVSLAFSNAFIPNNSAGSALLRVIFLMERVFPHLMARIGCYPLFIVRRTSGNEREV